MSQSEFNSKTKRGTQVDKRTDTGAETHNTFVILWGGIEWHTSGFTDKSIRHDKYKNIYQ